MGSSMTVAAMLVSCKISKMFSQVSTICTCIQSHTVCGRNKELAVTTNTKECIPSRRAEYALILFHTVCGINNVLSMSANCK